MSQISLPIHWKWATLGEICTIVRGVTFPSEVQRSQPSNEHIACLRTTNIQAQVDWDDLIYIPLEYIQGGDKLIVQDDILISIANSRDLVGKVAFVNEVKVKALFGGFVSVIRAATELVDAYYLYSFLASNNVQKRLRSVSNQTVNIANLTTKEIEKLSIPLPPLPEQRRIAKILHQADTLHQWREKTLELTSEYLSSLYDEMFGNIASDFSKQTPIEKILQPDSGILTGPFGTQLKVDELVDIGNPIYGIENVLPNQFIPDVNKYITDEKFEQLRRYHVSPSDVLLTRMGTIGRACVVPENIPGKAIMSYHLFRLRPNVDRCLPEFLAATLNYSPYVAHQLKNFAAGAVMSGLNSDTVRSIRITLPSLKLQEKYVKTVRQHINQYANLSTSKNLFDQLISSLLSHAFMGKLTGNWRDNHKEELQRAAVERDKALGLRGEKARPIDFKEGRVTPEELEVIRNALGNFAANLATYHIEIPDGIVRSFEEITKPLTQSLVSMSQNVIAPFLESFRQSLQNIQLPLPEIRLPDEEAINRQIDLLPLPQEKRAIHDVLDVTSLRVLKLAHASPAYFTPEDLTFGGITSTHTSASLRVLDSLGFVRLVEIDGVLRYHLIDANTDTALKPDQLQQ